MSIANINNGSLRNKIQIVFSQIFFKKSLGISLKFEKQKAVITYKEEFIIF